METFQEHRSSRNSTTFVGTVSFLQNDVRWCGAATSGMGPPANPAPDEGPGVLAGGGWDCSRCFSAGQLCRSMVSAQLPSRLERSLLNLKG